MFKAKKYIKQVSPYLAFCVFDLRRGRKVDRRRVQKAVSDVSGRVKIACLYLRLRIKTQYGAVSGTFVQCLKLNYD